MRERKTFKVRYAPQFASDGGSLFQIEGPGLQYIYRNNELAAFIEAALNAALAAFPGDPPD